MADQAEPSSRAEDEVSPDAIQLTTIAIFNGLCRLIRHLSANGLLLPEQLRDIHDAMTEPLDDPTFRDEETVVFVRTTLESVLAASVRDAKELDED